MKWIRRLKYAVWPNGSYCEKTCLMTCATNYGVGKKASQCKYWLRKWSIMILTHQSTGQYWSTEMLLFCTGVKPKTDCPFQQCTHINPQAQLRLWSACKSVKSDQSLHCPQDASKIGFPNNKCWWLMSNCTDTQVDLYPVPSKVKELWIRFSHDNAQRMSRTKILLLLFCINMWYDYQSTFFWPSLRLFASLDVNQHALFWYPVCFIYKLNII